MKRCNTKHMRFKGYADGGKVMKTEYGEPTFTRAVLEKVGIGDGYGNAKSAPKKERMDVSNATEKLSSVVEKRKRELDAYADGGRVRKRGC